MNIVRNLSLLVATSVVFVLVAFTGAEPALAANPCAANNPCGAAAAANPCAAKNPCGAAANPCGGGAVNPCAAKNPKVDISLVTRPSGTHLAKGDPAALIREGEKLFNDVTLGTNDIACQACHAENGLFKASFAKPYPHRVAMAANQGGMQSINLDEMIQFCILVPMAGKPLPWDSRELAALTAYTASLQKSFSADTGGANLNPCAARNPCSAK